MAEVEATPGDARDPLPADASPPAARRWWRRSFLWMAAEMVLISASVFLGLIGQQWYEDRERRQEATASLQRFQAEITINRDDVAKKLAYHAQMHKALRPSAYGETKTSEEPTFDGIKPPAFERSAWDLAVATQSLTDVDPELAFWLSRTYTFQNSIDELSRAFTAGMYVNPPGTSPVVFRELVTLYYDDLVGMEPNLLRMYDEVLSKIDAALAGD